MDENAIKEFARSKNMGAISSQKIGELGLKFANEYMEEIRGSKLPGECPLHVPEALVNETLSHPDATYEELFGYVKENFEAIILARICFSLARGLQQAAHGNMQQIRFKYE